MKTNPIRLSPFSLSLAVAIPALCLAEHAGAVNVLNDKFLDGTITNGTNAGETDTAYFTNRDLTTLTIVSDNTTGPDEGANDNALNFNPGGSTFRGFLGEFTSTTAAVGERLVLNFDIRYLASASGEFRFGLYNNGGTSVTGNNQAADSNDYGYRIALDRNGMAASTSLASEIGEAASDIGLGTTRAITGGTTSDFTAFGTVSQNVSLSVERTNATTNTITLGINGTTRGSWTDNATGASNGTAATFTFNEVFFSPTQATQVRFDNISVDLIPEPSTALLGALGALCLLRRRRA